MNRLAFLSVLPLAAACAGGAPRAGAPVPFALPDSVMVVDGRTGARVATADLLGRVRAADFVLLGEVHDDVLHHALRGQLIAAAEVRPAIVFEQFAESRGPIAPPDQGESLEDWLDANGFDREGWHWPAHRPVVEAALAHARALWGSGVSREALSGVVRGGESAAPAHLRALLERVPLDDRARVVLDSELVAGHCGQLPASMIPGMRTAQTVRDAAMANALVRAGDGGPAWLIAGNGHVRADVAVPRLLRVAAPGASILTVGFLERTAGGEEPDAEERAGNDLVVVTPHVERPDPCAGLMPSR